MICLRETLQIPNLIKLPLADWKTKHQKMSTSTIVSESFVQRNAAKFSPVRLSTNARKVYIGESPIKLVVRFLTTHDYSRLASCAEAFDEISMKILTVETSRRICCSRTNNIKKYCCRQYCREGTVHQLLRITDDENSFIWLFPCYIAEWATRMKVSEICWRSSIIP